MAIFGYLGEKITFKLRCLVFESVLEQEIKWFDRKENSSGTICARISDDGANIQSASGLRIGNLFQSISTFFIIIPLGFYYNWQMALFSLVLFPIIFLSSYLSIKRNALQAKEESKTSKYSSKIIVQVMNSIRTVISLNKQKFFRDKFDRNIFEHRDRMRRETFKKSVLYGISVGTAMLAYTLAFLYAGFLIKNSLVKVSDCFKIIESLIFGGMTVGQLLIISQNLAKAKHAIVSMMELIDLKPEESLSEIYCNEKLDGNVEFRNITFAYESRPKQKILNELSFRVNSGETVALVGASGCGKTTTIQLLEQFYLPDSGQIVSRPFFTPIFVINFSFRDRFLMVKLAKELNGNVNKWL